MWCSQFIPYLLDMHAKGELPLEELVTIYDMKDHAKAVEDSKAGRSLKAVLKW